MSPAYQSLLTEMGSLGSDDDDIKPNKGISSAEFCDTQPVDSDSHYSPSVSGEANDGINDGFQCLGETLPVDDDPVPANNVFETQQVEHDCETQLLNLVDETQVIDLGGDTQLLFDDCCGCKEETQLICESEHEEKDGNSDGEDSERTEVLSDCDAEGSIDVKSTNAGDDRVLGSEGVEPTSHGCQDDMGSKSATSPSLDNGACNSGTPRRGFTSVRAASLRASGLSARFKMALKVSGDGASCDMNGDKSSEQSEKGAEVKKATVAISTLRKLSKENLDIDENDHNNDTELAGLSYVNSQEPGECSQANALHFVDQFLKVSVFGYDQDVKHENPVGEKLDPAFSGKGAQRLAKKINLKHSLAEPGIYDWDDSLEDEGGGEFFCKKKEVPFGSSSRAQESCNEAGNPRHHNATGGRVPNKFSNEEHQLVNVHNKTAGLAYSVPNLSKTSSRKMGQGSSFNVRRNLQSDLDKQLFVESAGLQVETKAATSEMLNMLSIGIDTQMAAEAIEVLSNGANFTIEVSHQNKKDCGKKLKKEAAKGCVLKQHSTLKLSHPSDSGVTARPKRSRRPSDQLPEASKCSFASRTCSKKDAKLAVEENTFGLEQNKVNISILNENGVLDELEKIREEKKEGAQNEALNDNGSVLAKRQHIGEGQNTFSPIAWRTRKSMVTRHFNAIDRTSYRPKEKAHSLGTVADKRKKMRRNSGMDIPAEEKASELINGMDVMHIDGLSSMDGQIENNSAQASGSNIREDSLAVDHRGQTITRRRRSKRTIQSADLVNYGKFYAKKAVSSLKLQPVLLPCENDGLSSRDGQIENNSAQASGSNIREDSLAVDHTGQTITRSRRSKRTIRSADLVNYGKFYAKKAVSSLKLQPVLLPSENDPCCLLSGEKTKAKFQRKESPTEMFKSSNLACTTPVNCKTPTNASTPVCMGDEYHKLSCKKNLTGPSPVNELNRLTPSTSRCTVLDKGMRKRRNISSVRVLFSHHLDADIIRHQKKILTRLGVSVASLILEATHFVADEFVRTRNMLEAIARGIPVVTHLWVESCGQASCYLDEKNYILRDTKKEREIGFSMPASLALASQRPILRGKRVLITPNTKPGVEILTCLVKAVHGQAIERIDRSILRSAEFPDELIVLSCEEDYDVCVPLLEKGAAIYSSELLLNGIMVQKLEFERHHIFEDHTRTRSPAWMKKGGDKFHPMTRRK